MKLSDKHIYRVGSHSASWNDLPSDDDELDKFIASARKRIEPWLSAVFQAEHLNLLIGSGFTTAIGYVAGATTTGMGQVAFGSEFDIQIDAYAAREAALMGRGVANIEDQFRAALAVYEGLKVIDATKAEALKNAMDRQLRSFLESLLATESGLINGDPTKRIIAEGVVQSFLLSFASRAASRERLHIFTTNYDRLIEHGCDLAGLRIIDRFVGALTPVFRSARVEVDMHYNPPGIRGEPRFMEGVIRLTKLHGSLDWFFDRADRKIFRKGIPFGAPADHTDLPHNPVDTVMIYPNPAKDVETTQYPYAELFRDFAAATCRPNAVAVTYGYGFGDDHINRVLLDMLTIPSTHLVVFAYNADDRLKSFLARTREAQVSLLIGPHFGDLTTLIENYLPKPTLDYVTSRMTELMKHRPPEYQSAPEEPPPGEVFDPLSGCGSST
ncbi:SIR2 family protein [Gluconacetobacter tumulicola]|uniref:Fibronectin-binding protein (FBP) n=1 Tax=Gluconacetobacter tumulicola TaxID=1017177 RepID=A0A7W4JFU0_9PROT|nr:SIR2 family protein [Gluconacetobacter tumulicola]MBB2180408.1 fibronectin-binding protein (FBP) [Gluconacetobacter tumulicola]